ncbi:hypothetical protein HU200_013066 [Digitaria exilis]|uniref:Uncharacterized protein n=1 Tax=Digitaria exilis TaxID=1010633 RepID=A0A835FE04_9POAL|nr:hypothetical protein HU200_013066 [Digitaria exilis]
MNNLLTDSFERDEKPERERDIEMGKSNPKDKSDYGLEDFFQEVKEIEMLLDKMSNIVHKLQEANEESKSCIEEETERKNERLPGAILLPASSIIKANHTRRVPRSCVERRSFTGQNTIPYCFIISDHHFDLSYLVNIYLYKLQS